MEIEICPKIRREEPARTWNAFASALRAVLVLGSVAGCLTLAACSDESGIEPASAPPASEASAQTFHQLEWLRLTDGVTPEQWLASREAGRDLSRDDGAVVDMRHVLEVAASRFRDQPRMIANRAVQLEAMLREKNIEERAPRLIVSLSQVPGQTRHVDSFAALTQQYYNLRMEGLDRATALDALRQRSAMMR